jgi:hypothetical protein
MTTIRPELKATFSVDKCEHAELNGEHTITFNLANLTQDDLEQYVLQTLVIKYQGMLRSKTAADKGLVGKTTYDVPAPGKRISADPVKKVTDLLAKLTPEQIRSLLLAQLDEQDNAAN